MSAPTFGKPMQKWDSVANCKMKFKLNEGKEPTEEISEEEKDEELMGEDEEVSEFAPGRSVERLSMREMGEVGPLSFILCLRTAVRPPQHQRTSF